MNQEDGTVSVNVSVGGKKHSIFFRAQDKKLNLNPESIISATLLPSMKTGEVLAAPGEADQQFLSSLDQIQDIFTTWDDGFSRVVLETRPKKQPKNEKYPGGGVGTFFTGGVDSFYTLLKHKEEITHLIYVRGFELRKLVNAEIKTIADQFDKKVIEVETNLREFSNPIVPWSLYQGSALATVGHLLNPYFDKIYIPSTHNYADLFPWGTHPLVDPLWSSSALTFVHDGSEASRVDKIKYISKYKTALNALRVCHRNTGTMNNCGQCEKCIRTMIGLKAINALDQTDTFPNVLSLRKVARLNLKDDNTAAYVHENINYLTKREGNKKLVWALWWVLHKPKSAKKIRSIGRMLRNKDALKARIKAALG